MMNVPLINDAKSRSTVAIGLSVDPNPGTSSIKRVEVGPEVPPSGLCLIPVPKRPGLPRQLVHIGHVVARVEGSEFGIVSEISFAEFVPDCVTRDVRASNGESSSCDTSCPSVVVASVGD